MAWVYELCEIFATAYENILILWFLTSFFGAKCSALCRNISFAVFSLVTTLFVTIYSDLFNNEYIICTTLFIGIIFCYCHFFLKGNLLSHLLVLTAAETIVMLTAISMNSVSSFFYSGNSSYVIDNRGVRRIADLVLNKLILFVVYKIILLVTRKNKAELKQTEWIAFSAVFAATLLSGVCIYESRLGGNDNILLFMLTALSLIIINIVSYYMLVRISSEHRENMKAKLLEVQIKEQETNMNEMQSIYREMRRIRHDIQGQLGCLSELISNKNYEQAERYLNSIELPAFSSQAAICTDNDVINAILGYLSNKCCSDNIVLNYNISSVNIECFSPPDISVIITNLVTNACEACQINHADKIDVELSDKRNYYCIKVKNKIAQSVLIKNPNLKSTKSDNSVHGFGIESVRMIVDKYDGITNFYEENGCFIAEIWLKRPVGKK